MLRANGELPRAGGKLCCRIRATFAGTEPRLRVAGYHCPERKNSATRAACAVSARLVAAQAIGLRASGHRRPGTDDVDAHRASTHRRPTVGRVKATGRRAC
uniref:Uncharacterized protein n=1 Tax=Coccidioides posadasii RMSCC 3488 TaxID=454284 RepID=A0A0J6HZM4_COCPO|nr:hypothetical protein CPAG_00794 [Coccidioides posadasii RMSCC 3488]